MQYRDTEKDFDSVLESKRIVDYLLEAGIH